MRLHTAQDVLPVHLCDPLADVEAPPAEVNVPNPYGRRLTPPQEVEGGLFRPRTEKLSVGGDRTKLVDGVLRQVALVQDVVGSVSVQGALCFVDADWPLFGGSFTVRGIDVCWPKRLSKQLAALEGTVDLAAVAAAIAAHFPPA